MCAAENIKRMINTIISIWCKYTVGLDILSFDIICSGELTVFLELPFQNSVLLRKDNVHGQISSKHVFTLERGYYLTLDVPGADQIGL